MVAGGGRAGGGRAGGGVQIFFPMHFFVQFFSYNPEIRSKYSPP